MCYVYILQSIKDKRTYIGHTDSVARRLKQHNSGAVRSTNYRKPFKLLFSERFVTLSEAKKRELWWKSGAGRRKLKDFFR